VLGILNISGNLSSEGKSLPIRAGFDLRVTGAPAGLELWRGGAWLANGSAGECRFRGLPRGLYSLKAGGKEWTVMVNGDAAIDLTGKAAPEGDWKRIIGIILILVINLAGIALIIRIWRKGD